MKILILSLSAGSGHVRAAKAIEKYIESDQPDIQVTHKDVAYFLSPLGRLVHKHFYNSASRHSKWLWKMLYNITNQPYISDIISQNDIVRSHWAKKLRAYIAMNKPDAIICTHFTIPSFIVDICKKNNIKIYTLITDYCLHRAYALKDLDGYFVPRVEEKEELVRLGVHPNKIHITGIPIDSVFFEHKNIQHLREKYSIPQQNKVVTLFAKNYSKRTVRRIVKKLSSVPDLTIFVIQNKIPLLTKNDIRCIHHTPDVDEYIRVSNVVVTKSGGLTTTECIALRKPIMVFEPIPGLEDANAHYIVKNKFGTLCIDIKKIDTLVETYLHNDFIFPSTQNKELASKKIVDVITRMDSM